MRAFVSSAIFAAVVSVTGFSPAVQKVDEKPVAKEKSESDQWLPRKKTATKDKSEEKITLPRSAFPDICLTDPDVTDPKWEEKRQAEIKIKLQRLLGAKPLKIDRTDDTARKLLKARLHQGVLEYQYRRDFDQGGPPDRSRIPFEIEWLSEMRVTAVGLFAEEPGELVSWLEELVVAGKEMECHMIIRVQARAFSLADLYAVSRTRLKIESELLKAKNKK